MIWAHFAGLICNFSVVSKYSDKGFISFEIYQILPHFNINYVSMFNILLEVYINLEFEKKITFVFGMGLFLLKMKEYK